jgi:type IV secretion system protein TrbL
VSCAPWNPTGCVSDIAKSVAGDAFSSIAHDFGHMADSAINWLWAQTSTAAAVHLGGAGFDVDVAIVAAIAVTVAVGLFVIQVITATLRRDVGGLGRACRGLVVAFIGGGIAIAATNLLLNAVDSLSAGVVQVATGGSISTLGHAILAGGTVTSVTANPAGIILLSLATLAAVMMVWAALMVRKVLIVVSAVFAPIAFAGSLADITTSWVRRWIEVTAALIFSKLILVLIFLVGWGMLTKGVGQASQAGVQTTTQAVSGLLVLALAGFAPWLALKMVHWTGDQFHHLHTMASTSTAGAQKALAAPQKVRPLAMAALGTAGAAGAAGSLGAAGAGREGAQDRSGPQPSPGPGRGSRPGSNSPPAPGPQSPGQLPVATPPNPGPAAPAGPTPNPTPAPARAPAGVSSGSAQPAARSPNAVDETGPGDSAANPDRSPSAGGPSRWIAQPSKWPPARRELSQS